MGESQEIYLNYEEASRIRKFREISIQLGKLMGTEEYYSWVYKVNQDLEKDFPKQEKVKYKIWHVFVGGSYGNGPESPYLDFPGKFSLIKITSDKLKEYEKNKS